MLLLHILEKVKFQFQDFDLFNIDIKTALKIIKKNIRQSYKIKSLHHPINNLLVNKTKIATSELRKKKLVFNL